MCRHTLAVLDGELGARPHERISEGVRELVAWKAARQSFADASEDLAHCHALEVSSSEIARIAHEEGQRACGILEARDERWSEPVATDRPVFTAEIEACRLVVEVDGTAMLTREWEEHKTVWVARACDADCRGEDGSGRQRLTDSRYAADAGDLEEFNYRVDALANRMGARSAQEIAVVADGAPALWNLLPSACQTPCRFRTSGTSASTCTDWRKTSSARRVVRRANEVSVGRGCCGKAPWTTCSTTWRQSTGADAGKSAKGSGVRSPTLRREGTGWTIRATAPPDGPPGRAP